MTFILNTKIFDEELKNIYGEMAANDGAMEDKNE
jgi:hypothetical protein